MDDLRAFFISPLGSFIAVVLIGIIAGWIYEKISASTHGYITSALVGIAASYLGYSVVTFAFGVGVPAHVTPIRLTGAILGTAVILWAWRTVKLVRS